MKNYKGILFKVGDGPVRNSSEWNCYVTESLYIPVATKAKNITSQSWFDENGDDEYIPQDLCYSPVETTLSFAFKGTINDANAQIRSFIDYLQTGFFQFYDEYYKIGRQKARVLDFSDKAQFRYDDKTSETGVATFEIKIKINDPVTNITLANENI